MREGDKWGNEKEGDKWENEGERIIIFGSFCLIVV